MMQDLARYWATDYDWRKCEAKLNDLPHFVTEIDGLDIHFIHVRSQHPDALPLIVTHGWPGSVIERLPRRALSSPAELGRARVFRQPHPLQQARSVITDENRMFRAKLSRAEQSFASELRDTGNKLAHGAAFSADDTYRALDTMERLLTAADATRRRTRCGSCGGTRSRRRSTPRRVVPCRS